MLARPPSVRALVLAVLVRVSASCTRVEDPGPGSDEVAGAAAGKGGAGQASAGEKDGAAEAEPADAGPSPLDGWEPLLKDPTGDQKGRPSGDIEYALAVKDARALYVRFKLKGPFAPKDPLPDLRFWAEHQPELVTVEVKTSSSQRECELSRAGQAEGTVVPKCFTVGDGLIDVTVPLASMPSWASGQDAWFISGFQTCCVDKEREQPLDEIDAAQEVWRAPGSPGGIPAEPVATPAGAEAATPAGDGAAAATPAAPAPGTRGGAKPVLGARPDGGTKPGAKPPEGG